MTAGKLCKMGKINYGSGHFNFGSGRVKRPGRSHVQLCRAGCAQCESVVIGYAAESSSTQWWSVAFRSARRSRTSIIDSACCGTYRRDWRRFTTAKWPSCLPVGHSPNFHCCTDVLWSLFRLNFRCSLSLCSVVFTLVVSIGKRNVIVWRPSVRPSDPSF